MAEILSGELFASTRPAYPHAFAASALGMKIKLAIYARESVRYAWLVDPLQQTLEVFGLESAHWTVLATHETDARVRAEPFEAIEPNSARSGRIRSAAIPQSRTATRSRAFSEPR